MFDLDDQRAQIIVNCRLEFLKSQEIDLDQWRKVFYNFSSTRLNHYGFELASQREKFMLVEMPSQKFKVQDLVKISKLNSNLFFIDLKKSHIYTLDTTFRNWCAITGNNRQSLQL